MALLEYGNKFVDDRFSPLVEPNLFDNNVFQPNVTFTDKYQIGAAGQVLVHKLGKVAVSSSTPGGDFTHTDTADSTIILPIDKAFQRSEKIYNVQAGAVSYDIAASHMEQALADIREGWNSEIAGVLEAGTTASEAGTTALAADTIYGIVVDDRQALVENGAKPNVMIVSPATYALLLKSDQFLRAGDLGDNVVATGQVGSIAGLAVFEYQGLASTTDYVIYDKDALSVVTSINMMRMIDSPDFNGTLAQVEIVSGFAITNQDRVLVKENA